jgi:two-component system KDP operon response regulator KdpE
LIIDDELQIRRLLGACLESEGYSVLEAPTGQEGINQTVLHRPDVVILDLGLPDMDGIALLKRLREWSRVPVVVLSGRDQAEDKIAALDNGADDYVTKPFRHGELMARLRVAQRHAATSPENPLFRSGELEVDLAARVVTFKSQEVTLTATEYAMLRLFVQHVGKVLTQPQILREVWGLNNVGKSNYVRVYMAHLREKLEANPTEPRLLLTEPGVGYRLAGKE